MSTQEKTITCVPFLNERLKPRVLNDGSEAFPVYIRVIYNSKNTHVPLHSVVSSMGGHTDPVACFATKESFDYLSNITKNERNYRSIHEATLAYFIEDVVDLLKSIIEFETKLKPNRYSLKGLSKRIEIFKFSIFDRISNYLVEELKHFFSYTYFKSYNQLIDSSQDFIYNYELLVQIHYLTNFAYPTVILPEMIKWNFKFEDLPETLMNYIELYFLLGACYNSNVGLNYGRLVLYGEQKRFERFLENEALYDPRVTLKVPLPNRFSRLLSLCPPTHNKVFYINMLEELLGELRSKHLTLMG